MPKSKIRSKTPSFSSTLLEEIYNSFDAKNPMAQHFFFPDNVNQRNRSVVDRKFDRDRFFGSVSSSDSNSSIFSSSDKELTHGKKTSSRPLCFGPSRTKPTKTEDKALFCGNRTHPVFDDYGYSSDTSKITRHEDIWENQRSRWAKNSGDFKNPKTPFSPGGRIVSFLNSLFRNSRKTMAAKINSRKTSYNDDGFARKPHDYPSTCSSATSSSRSRLDKCSDKQSDGEKRSVGSSPLNSIVSGNSSSRSFVGKTSIYTKTEQIYDSKRFMSSSLPGEWNIRKPPKKNTEDGGWRSAKEIARDLLRDYQKNKNIRDYEKNQNRRMIRKTDNTNDFEDYEDEDDNGSDSSSDLFELDLVGNHQDMYRDELPVYETTSAGLIL